MPTSTKYREKSNTYVTHNFYDSRTYSGRRQYQNTSSAYDYPTFYPERMAPVQTKPKVAAPERERAAGADARVRASAIRACAIAVLAFILCFSVIYRYSVILESNQEIKALEKQYEGILSENQIMQGKIDRYLEMGEVEKIAREQLGMMKPETYQIFYIDIKMDDLGGNGSTASSESAGAITGTPGALVNAFRVYNSYSR